ncbi:MAG: orotidine-5'-phosphate decarboxylase [Thermoplasmata archaeon]|nr:orotidine-5'-phosphate decarboxylase [Thermoplasmata archaeon]
MPERFQARVDRILRARNSLLCVGLDPDPALFPAPLKRLPAARRLPTFLDGVIAATRPYAAAYKMQLGAYLAFGPPGVVQLERLVRKIGPHHLRILDMKANDIPNTMRLIRDGVFGQFGFDAVTVTPWLGWETIEPFSEDPSKGVLIVAHSSNNGAPDFQEIPTPRGPLWLAVVGEVARLSALHGNAGAVVGATYIDAIRAARAQLGNEVPILVPGVGAQGGQLSATVREGVDGHGRGLLINSSRGILYASSGKDWKKTAGAEAKRLMDQINQLRSGIGTRA